MDNLPFALFALGYSGLVLFWLAHALRKLYPAMRAALMAFGISAAVHGVTMLFVPPEHVPTALAFWGVPHLLLLPLLLWTARRHANPP
ncbi:MAG: hypothetical protein K2X11_18350 [Acetobacteraceae bacterium]|nr:hypothetical protein [Acetobacteraceae bacterium]